MIKKILLVLICAFALISCGKKGDPEYKQSNLKLTTNSPIKLKIQ